MLSQSAKASIVRGTVEQAIKVNIQTIYAAVCKGGHPICSMTWTCGARLLGIGVALLSPDRLIVVVSGRSYSAEVTYVKPHLGGVSRLLKCPLACARNVVTLFVTEVGMACRACSGLNYRSQLEHSPDRARRRALKIMDRLAPGHTPLMTIPGRPVGMHRRTYLRNISALACLLQTSDEAIKNQVLKTRNQCCQDKTSYNT